MGKEAMGELAVEGQWECIEHSVGNFERHLVVRSNALRVHDVFVWEHIGWRASDHGCVQAGIVAVLDDVEGCIGRANNSDRLQNEVSQIQA